MSMPVLDLQPFKDAVVNRNHPLAQLVDHYEAALVGMEAMAAFMSGLKRRLDEAGRPEWAAGIKGMLDGLEQAYPSLLAQNELAIRQEVDRRVATLVRKDMRETADRVALQAFRYRLGKILNAPYYGDQESSCTCDECNSLTRGEPGAEPWRCDTCGYAGRPSAYQCACYDRICTPSSPGAGCFHGGLFCPICGDGEIDVWKVIRAVRSLAEDGSDEDISKVLGRVFGGYGSGPVAHAAHPSLPTRPAESDAAVE